MKKINKWFFFNPLFVLYTDSKWFIEALKDPNQKETYYYDPLHDLELDPFDYDERQMDPRETNEIEGQLFNDSSANCLRKQFAENENFEGLLDALKEESEKIPIALITFVLSVFLATDFEFRQKFYTLYQGKKVPAITQFCLNVFRLSPISDREWIAGFDFIDDEYQATLGCCGLGVTFADKRYLKLYPEYVVAWFDLWEEHFNSHEKNYMEPVEFNRVPHVSTDKNYLCDLTVGNQDVTCSETSYFHELSYNQQETYSMLARVLDSVCVPENTVLPVPHKDIVERSLDEGEIIPKLIRFIISECKSFLV